ncbi:MAG: DUF4954 family protein [Spirochaetaceae bacterium]|jgi:hypothetical protein|nr:DUF4954 family protein [Spirochaetaceae bacterium]
MELSMLPAGRYGYDFIPGAFLPPGKDEYWRRNQQRPPGAWRPLSPAERDALEANNNYCPAWDDFLVSDPFDASLIRNSSFYGLVRVGKLRRLLLRHHDFTILSGIRNSTVISCDIGDDAAIQDCSYISHYIIGDAVILSRIDELQATNHAKFGNGVIMRGEEEEVRVRIDVMNEAGGRSILPFRDMLPADAYLWSSFRDDTELNARLEEITQEEYGGERGAYGTIGRGSVLKSCRIIKDAAIGEAAYIKGANKLKNITVLSSEEEPSQIGEGVELVNGIVGYGCHVFYGAKAVRFVMGRNCNLKYGARLIHSVLGDNSTISCCEVLNNLVFPVHEQHHNNSFLIASLIGGMSNMAAGATIGSNHNSRANDGELRAGRGFWPGLSVTLKHPSRFASFVLITKGNYPGELNIGFPFSLVNNNTRLDRLEVMPAYFWIYNLYALERNSWKAENRDRRKVKAQIIETDYLAPDTAEEILSALAELESRLPEAGAEDGGEAAERSNDEADPEYDYEAAPGEELAWPGLERSGRQQVILKPRRARAAYREMLEYYALKTILDWFAADASRRFEGLLTVTTAELSGEDPSAGEPSGTKDWVNLGGQIAPAFRLDRLRRDIREGRSGWGAIHGAYAEMAAAYPQDRLRHAWSLLARFGGGPCTDAPGLRARLPRLLEIRRGITEGIYRSRAKDYSDPFRGITYRNRAEMERVAGTAEDNSFVRLSRERLAAFERRVEEVGKRL